MEAIVQGTCDEYCESGGHGSGVVIGTAPFCGGNCDTDCRGACTSWPANCWTGGKICCCGKSSIKN